MSATVNANLDSFSARLIRKADFAPCASAFVDLRLPGSEGQLNYSFVTLTRGDIMSVPTWMFRGFENLAGRKEQADIRVRRYGGKKAA